MEIIQIIYLKIKLSTTVLPHFLFGAPPATWIPFRKQASSSIFGRYVILTSLINVAAITPAYYATPRPSQLPCSESHEVPNLKDDVEMERCCSLAQSSPSLTIKADVSSVSVSVGTCVQLVTGLATDTTQTLSRLKLKPELSSQHPRLGLTTRSSQSVLNTTHNQHTYSFDDGSIEVPTSSVCGPSRQPRFAATSKGTWKSCWPPYTPGCPLRNTSLLKLTNMESVPQTWP